MPDNQLDIEIGERLTEVVNKFYNGSSRQLALKFDIDPSQMLKIQKGTRGLTVEKAVDIATAHNIDLNWLLHGTGEMIIEEKFELAEGATTYQLKPGEKNFRIAEADLKTVRDSLRILQTIFESTPAEGKLLGPTENLLDKKKGQGNGANKRDR